MHLTQMAVNINILSMDAALLLKDEIDFLKKHLEDLESHPALTQLAGEIRQRIDTLRRQLRALQDKQ
jgi:hypothetical protein